jgi:Uma2 family endonuclease
MTVPATTTSDTHAATTEQEPLRMSYEEWLSWDHESGLSEWVDGEVIIHMPTKPEHQRVVDFLNRLLGLFVQLFGLGEVYSAPLAMRLAPGGPAREPDLFFLATEHQQLLNEKELAGPADLAIEVISDDSISRDRADKFYEYQAGAVREYWIIDPRAGQQRVDVYVRDAKGRYQPIPATADGVFHSSVLPGFWLREEWLWADKPNPLAALAEIVGVERVIEALRESA